MFRQWLITYFSFTRKERTGILILLALVIIATVLPLCYPLFYRPLPTNSTWLKQEAVALIQQQNNHAQGAGAHNYTADGSAGVKNTAPGTYTPPGELFLFDPNTLSPEGWKKLGLRDRTITTIQRYLAKGGHFYQPGDIGKIWGLHKDEVQRLLPYVRIASRNATKQEELAPRFDRINSYQRSPYTIPPASIDINTADTTAWIALPGIGSRLAARIVLFRERLGGFYSIAQVGETYGLSDSVFRAIQPKLHLGSSTLRQLNINTASIEDLKRHPLIRYNIANAIVQYRNQHSLFTKVEDIKKIVLVTGELFNKLQPYLTVN